MASLSQRLFGVTPIAAQVKKPTPKPIVPLYSKFVRGGGGNPPPPASWLTNK